MRRATLLAPRLAQAFRHTAAIDERLHAPGSRGAKQAIRLPTARGTLANRGKPPTMSAGRYRTRRTCLETAYRFASGPTAAANRDNGQERQVGVPALAGRVRVEALRLKAGLQHRRSCGPLFSDSG